MNNNNNNNNTYFINVFNLLSSNCKFHRKMESQHFNKYF